MLTHADCVNADVTRTNLYPVPVAYKYAIQLSPPCSSSPYKELLLHQGMPLPWVRKGSGPLMLRPVVQLVSVLSLWSLSLWVDGVKRQLTPSPVLVVYWVNVWESLPVNLSDTFSSDVLYLYGEATRPSGFVVIPFILRQLMVSYD